MKGMAVSGRFGSVLDNYELDEGDAGPTCNDTKDSFKTMAEYLESRAKLKNFVANPLPLIQDGIISCGAVLQVYEYKDCLVINGYRPYFSDEMHMLYVAGKDTKKLNDVLKELQDASSYTVKNYWRPLKPSKVRMGKAEDIAERVRLLLQ